MTDNEYEPGDVVNDHMLGTDGQWHPIALLVTQGLSTGAKIAIGAGVFAVLLLIGVIGQGWGGWGDEPVTAPVTVTVTPPTPTPTPETSSPEPVETSVTDDPEYDLVLRFMDIAMKQSDANLDLVCLQYAKNPAKHNADFVRIATKNIFSYSIAVVAVPDWFERECGT